MVWPDGIATLIGGIAAFVFGSVYYMALAGPWRRAAGLDPEEAKPGPVQLAFMLVFTLLIAGGVGWLLATLGIRNSVPSAVIVMAIVWFTMVFAPMSVNHRAQRRPWTLTAIDAAYWLFVIEIAALTHILWAGAPKFG